MNKAAKKPAKQPQQSQGQKIQFLKEELEDLDQQIGFELTGQLDAIHVMCRLRKLIRALKVGL
jgi:hypothetical protein